MLIEFTVGNFRSFNEPQTFSMVASPGKELANTNTTRPSKAVPALLNSAAIYGPNAGGKSNFLRAIHFMQLMVLTSATGVQAGQQLNVKPFALTKKMAKAPSQFEITFIEKDIRYQYGFATTASHVLREWLIAYRSNRPQKWFERTYDPKSKKTKWIFGPNFKGPHKIWREATRNNALFLSTAVQLNNEQLRPIFNWFQQKLTVVVPGVNFNPVLTYNLFKDSKAKKRVLDFLRAADVGIDDIQLDRQLLKPNEGAQKPFQGELVLMGPGQLEALSVKSLHKSLDSKELVAFDISEESDGTKKIFYSIGAWLRILSNGSTAIVDELDSSLHPKLLHFLISLFHESPSSKLHSQLIFSTHDTSLLSNKLFRRDQIWFIEKSRDQSSILYSMSEFSPRKDEAFEKNYLSGRYGGLPIIGNLPPADTHG